MDSCGMGSLLLTCILLVSSGVQSLKPQNALSPDEDGSSNVLWQDELCCDSPGAPHTVEDSAASAHSTESRLPLLSQCNFKSQHQQLQPSSGALCVDVECRIRDDWRALTCELHSDQPVFSTTPAAMSLQPVLSDSERISVPDDPVTCEGNTSLKCSLALGSASSVVTLNISIAHVAASPVHLNLPPTPVKPSAPVNVSHQQTIDAELFLNWESPPEESRSLRYEVRHSSNATDTGWEVLQVFGERRLLLDLEVNVNYTLQVRSSGLVDPPLWSDWSEPHHIHLDPVSYIPEIVKVSPGEAVTIHCVFNDHNFNSSSAQWILNYFEPLDSSKYQPLNHWVSQITVQPLETTMYDIVLCSQENALFYSQIYVEGASINISCQTNGGINAMDCSWENKEPTNPKFLSRWSDVPCDEMEQRERAGEELGEPGPMCINQRSCRIRPLRMNCYRLWLQMDSPLGPINSKPIYVSPIEHVKPRTVSNITAVSRSSGVLSVSWDPPALPVQGVQCQLRFHAPSSVGQPEWTVQPPVFARGDEVPIPDMCLSYAVEVRCRPIHGTGYWSDWSKTVYSVPQNSRAPERGPDFWRILSNDPKGNRTTVTLLFEHLQTSGLSYCIDGLIIRHQPLGGSVREERIGLRSSHRFEWNHEVHAVTVKAYNRLGPSKDNFNMTLSRQVQRAVFSSFHVLMVNRTCASVSWTIVDSSSVPQYMVLQWFPHSPQETDVNKGSPTWRRLHFTDRPVHIRAVRREPGAYMLLMIICLLSIVLFVTLVLTQNRMKKIVWKEVPNPNKCSWARGLDFRKVDTVEHLLRAPQRLPAWPVLLPFSTAETISSVVIMEKADHPTPVQPPFVSFTAEPATSPASRALEAVPDSCHRDSQTQSRDENPENPIHNVDVLNPEIDALLPSNPQILDIAKEHSAQSSVTYTTVLLSQPKTKQQSRDSSGCSSSDEGNFSANNSDISDSSHGALWELVSCRGGDLEVDNRRSCSYNSVEELSESSEPEDEDKREKDLYYLKLHGEDSEGEQDESRNDLLKRIVLSKEDGSCPLLDAEDSNEQSTLLSAPPCGLSPLYLPQYRTAPTTGPFKN
uniref:Leptin receptor n=1 Tax=Neogobius melanostomus TaxID=47308 RepID=A0A8C6UCP7_9GOBI